VLFAHAHTHVVNDLSQGVTYTKTTVYAKTYAAWWNRKYAWLNIGVSPPTSLKLRRKSTLFDETSSRAFEQGGIFIVPHLLWHGTSAFPVSSEGLPHAVASYDTHVGMRRTYSNSDPHEGTDNMNWSRISLISERWWDGSRLEESHRN
jgi:hypothetical protein